MPRIAPSVSLSLAGSWPYHSPRRRRSTSSIKVWLSLPVAAVASLAMPASVTARLPLELETGAGTLASTPPGRSNIAPTAMPRTKIIAPINIPSMPSAMLLRVLAWVGVGESMCEFGEPPRYGAAIISAVG